MGMAETIRSRLDEALAPERIEIVDESHLHAGHAGARAGGESHFRVTVVADVFEGKSRVERQRLVYAALGELMRERIHALQLATFTSTEARRSR